MRVPIAVPLALALALTLTLTLPLTCGQVNVDAAHNKYLPPAGSGSNQKGLPPAELHTVAITQLLYAPAMFKDKYLTLSKDNTLKLWRTRTLQHMRTVQLGRVRGRGRQGANPNPRPTPNPTQVQLGEGTGWINAAIHLPDVKRLV